VRPACALTGKMPSKYGKEFAVPKEFPSVLKAFTRECLRSQPSNIYEFGAQYFTELQAQADAAANADAGGARRLSKAELEELLRTMFIEADADGSGALSINEFKDVLKMADLGLPEKEARKILAEADMDGNGEISYEEFVPLAVDLVHAMYARMDAEEASAEEEAQAREEAKNYLVHGMNQEEVETIMGEIFKKSDVDGSGHLDVNEFQKCCKDADIGLTRKEVNILMHQCDVDGDGTISYDEFVPLCFEMLVEIMKDELLQEKRSGDDLVVFLQEIWAQADSRHSGLLGVTEMKQALIAADLGLNKVQLHSVLSEGSYDENGECDYAAFAPKASQIVYRMLDMDAQIERAEAINGMLGGEGGGEKVHGMDNATFTGSLQQIFDDATGGAGVVAVGQLVPLLQSCAIPFSGQEMNGLFSTAADFAVEGGMVDYVGMCEYAFYIVLYIQQDGAIY